MIDDVELRRLAEAATHGKWRAIDGDIWVLSDTDYPTYPIFDDSRRRQKSWTNRPLRAESDANAAYIAAMHPETTLALLDRLAKLEADLMRYKKAVAAMAFGEVPDDAATRRLTPFPGKPMVVVMSTPSPSNDDVE